MHIITIHNNTVPELNSTSIKAYVKGGRTNKDFINIETRSVLKSRDIQLSFSN